MLLGMGWQDPDIARALSISPPTLRKHYFRELRSRDDARLRLRATHLEMVWEPCRAGNVSDLKEFRRLMDRAEAEDADPKSVVAGKGGDGRLGCRCRRHL